MKEYTWSEIRKHNQEGDLWLVMANRIYDVTEFQIDHPGGPGVFIDNAAQGIVHPDFLEYSAMNMHTHTIDDRCNR